MGLGQDLGLNIREGFESRVLCGCPQRLAAGQQGEAAVARPRWGEHSTAISEPRRQAPECPSPPGAGTLNLGSSLGAGHQLHLQPQDPGGRRAGLRSRETQLLLEEALGWEEWRCRAGNSKSRATET